MAERVNRSEVGLPGSLLGFAAAFMLGLAVASFALWQLLLNFRCLDEFYLVALALTAFATIATLTFAVIWRTGGSERALGMAALLAAIAALAFSGFPRWMDMVDAIEPSVYPNSARDMQIVLELLVPALIADFLIWRLSLRVWRRQRGADTRTTWPWFTILSGAALVFNPLGLDVLSSAIRQSPTDWFAMFWLQIVAGVTVLLLILAWIEHAVRTRILRHSSVQAEA